MKSCFVADKDLYSDKRVGVAIIGAGHVGSTTAYTLMLDGSVRRIALIDTQHDKAEGEGLDLAHCAQFTPAVEIVTGDSYELAAHASIIIITAGAHQKDGESRRNLFLRNYDLFQKILPNLVKINKEAIYLIVTNPVDALTYSAKKITGLPACQLFGTGTVLDTARLRYLIGNYLKVSPKDIAAYVLGEHGDSSFIWWSRATVGGSLLREWSEKKLFDQMKENFFLEEVRAAAMTIIARKGFTNFAIAEVISKIVRAIALDQSRVFTVSHLFDDYALGVPVVVRSNGICQQLPLVFDEQEKKQYEEAAFVVKELIKNI